MRIHHSVFTRTFVFSTMAFVLSLAFVAVKVNANTMSECQALIAALKADTESVVILGKNAEKNRAGLVTKLDGASVALDRGKLCDAIRKLTDYRNKVNQLIVSGSINADPAAGVTGQDLVNGADESIACVQSLVALSGVTCPVSE